jgi:hypothetical protein
MTVYALALGENTPKKEKSGTKKWRCWAVIVLILVVLVPGAALLKWMDTQNLELTSNLPNATVSKAQIVMGNNAQFMLNDWKQIAACPLSMDCSNSENFFIILDGFSALAVDSTRTSVDVLSVRDQGFWFSVQVTKSVLDNAIKDYRFFQATLRPLNTPEYSFNSLQPNAAKIFSTTFAKYVLTKDKNVYCCAIPCYRGADSSEVYYKLLQNIVDLYVFSQDERSGIREHFYTKQVDLVWRYRETANYKLPKHFVTPDLFQNTLTISANKVHSVSNLNLVKTVGTNEFKFSIDGQGNMYLCSFSCKDGVVWEVFAGPSWKERGVATHLYGFNISPGKYTIVWRQTSEWRYWNPTQFTIIQVLLDPNVSTGFSIPSDGIVSKEALVSSSPLILVETTRAIFVAASESLANSVSNLYICSKTLPFDNWCFPYRLRGGSVIDMFVVPDSKADYLVFRTDNWYLSSQMTDYKTAQAIIMQIPDTLQTMWIETEPELQKVMWKGETASSKYIYGVTGTSGEEARLYGCRKQTLNNDCTHYFTLASNVPSVTMTKSDIFTIGSSSLSASGLWRFMPLARSPNQYNLRLVVTMYDQNVSGVVYEQEDVVSIPGSTPCRDLASNLVDRVWFGKRELYMPTLNPDLPPYFQICFYDSYSCGGTETCLEVYYASFYFYLWNTAVEGKAKSWTVKITSVPPYFRGF